MPPRKDAARPPFEYEFFGPVGTAFIMATLPITIVGLYAFCNEDVGCSVLPPAPLSAAIAAVEAHMPLITPLDAGLVLGWFMLHVVLYVVLPGPVRQGITNPDGSKLSYTMNGSPQRDLLPWLTRAPRFTRACRIALTCCWTAPLRCL